MKPDAYKLWIEKRIGVLEKALSTEQKEWEKLEKSISVKAIEDLNNTLGTPRTSTVPEVAS